MEGPPDSAHRAKSGRSFNSPTATGWSDDTRTRTNTSRPAQAERKVTVPGGASGEAESEARWLPGARAGARRCTSRCVDERPTERRCRRSFPHPVSFPMDRCSTGGHTRNVRTIRHSQAPRERHGRPGDRAPERTYRRQRGEMDARSAEVSASAHLWCADERATKRRADARGSDVEAWPAQAGRATTTVSDSFRRKSGGLGQRARDRQMARRPDGGNIRRARRTCWAQRGLGGRVAASPARLHLTVGQSGGARFANASGKRSAAASVAEERGTERSGRGRERVATSLLGARAASGASPIHELTLVRSDRRLRNPARAVLLAGDGNIAGRRWSPRDVSIARKGPRASTCSSLRSAPRAEGRRAGEGQMRPDPGRSTRLAYALRCRQRRLSRASRPGRRSMLRKVHGFGSRRKPVGARDGEGRGGASIGRAPPRVSASWFAGERVHGGGAGCSGALSVWRHIGGGTDDGSRRRSGWQHRRRTTDPLRGAGPKGTVRRPDRAEREEVVGRASGTAIEARAVHHARDPAGAGFVRRTARFDPATRDGCRDAQARRRTLSRRHGRHCTTSSDDVVATAPRRIHRGDREGNLQGRRGAAGEATHVERRVRQVRPSGRASRFGRRDDVRTDVG